jgi:hypothetical protein
MSITNNELRDIVCNGDLASTHATPRYLAQELLALRENPRDDYHTMDELYEQRMLWNAFAAAMAYRKYPGLVTKSWRHHDGEPCFGKTEPGERWFIVTMELPSGQVTQHYPEKEWDLFPVRYVPNAPIWDGHDAAEGNRRLREAIGLYAPQT